MQAPWADPSRTLPADSVAELYLLCRRPLTFPIVLKKTQMRGEKTEEPSGASPNSENCAHSFGVSSFFMRKKKKNDTAVAVRQNTVSK